MLGRKLTWLICMVHINELGLKHLFDRKTSRSGQLGKLLKTVDSMKRDYSFKVS